MEKCENAAKKNFDSLASTSNRLQKAFKNVNCALCNYASKYESLCWNVKNLYGVRFHTT